jgi:hypothetical protein
MVWMKPVIAAFTKRDSCLVINHVQAQSEAPSVGTALAGCQRSCDSALLRFLGSPISGATFDLPIEFFGSLLASDSKAVGGATRGIAIAYVLVWYFAAARGQVQYVKTRFGNSYNKKN